MSPTSARIVDSITIHEHTRGVKVRLMTTSIVAQHGFGIGRERGQQLSLFLLMEVLQGYVCRFGYGLRSIYEILS